jgi:hypothetical protein
LLPLPTFEYSNNIRVLTNLPRSTVRGTWSLVANCVELSTYVPCLEIPLLSPFWSRGTGGFQALLGTRLRRGVVPACKKTLARASRPPAVKLAGGCHPTLLCGFLGDSCGNTPRPRAIHQPGHWEEPLGLSMDLFVPMPISYQIHTGVGGPHEACTLVCSSVLYVKKRV